MKTGNIAWAEMLDETREFVGCMARVSVSFWILRNKAEDVASLQRGVERKYAEARHHFAVAASSMSPIVNDPGFKDDSAFG